jgi:hypothetical protein
MTFSASQPAAMPMTIQPMIPKPMVFLLTFGARSL